MTLRARTAARFAVGAHPYYASRRCAAFGTQTRVAHQDLRCSRLAARLFHSVERCAAAHTDQQTFLAHVPRRIPSAPPYSAWESPSVCFFLGKENTGNAERLRSAPRARSIAPTCWRIWDLMKCGNRSLRATPPGATDLRRAQRANTIKRLAGCAAPPRPRAPAARDLAALSQSLRRL